MKVVNILLLVVLVSSCEIKYRDSISGNGHVTDRMLNLQPFTTLILPEHFGLVLIPADTQKLVLHADENLLDVIQINPSVKSLELVTTKRIRMARAREVWLYGSGATKIRCGPGSTIQCSDSVSLHSLHIIAGMHSDIRLHGLFDSLTLQIGPGSLAELQGNTDYLVISAYGGSNVFGYKLKASNAAITAVSGSKVQTTITGNARFSTSSFAKIFYTGKPVLQECTQKGLSAIRFVAVTP